MLGARNFCAFFATGSFPLSSCIRQRQLEAIEVYHAAGAPVFPPDWMSPGSSGSDLSPLQRLEPYNPKFAVDGLAVGGIVYPDSAIYMSYKCRPSDDFAGFTWCAVHQYGKEQILAVHLLGDHFAFQRQ